MRNRNLKYTPQVDVSRYAYMKISFRNSNLHLCLCGNIPPYSYLCCHLFIETETLNALSK